MATRNRLVTYAAAAVITSSVAGCALRNGQPPVHTVQGGTPGQMDRGKGTDVTASAYMVSGILPQIYIETNRCPPGEIFNNYTEKCQPVVRLSSRIITNSINSYMISHRLSGDIVLIMDNCDGPNSVEDVTVRLRGDYVFPPPVVDFSFAADGKVVRIEGSY